MPPVEVRPQTFDSFQSPDSASPAVRLEKSKLTCGLKILRSQALLRATHSLVVEVLNAGVWFSLPPLNCTATAIFEFVKILYETTLELLTLERLKGGVLDP